MADDRDEVFWRRSSYSAFEEANCCEVALLSGKTWVCDSKCPSVALLVFTQDAWRPALEFFSSWNSE
ncbi:DUF397 domain-containing protein [Streptomyces fuscichromogenes]|nr:DUF397 domain-containing protein [Streptomyces fuscichromogenes]